jgi:hypothetical protein
MLALPVSLSLNNFTRFTEGGKPLDKPNRDRQTKSSGAVMP